MVGVMEFMVRQATIDPPIKSPGNAPRSNEMVREDAVELARVVCQYSQGIRKFELERELGCSNSWLDTTMISAIHQGLIRKQKDYGKLLIVPTKLAYETVRALSEH